MTTATRTQRLTGSRVAALITQALSFLTTVWFVEWMWPGGTQVSRYLVALLAEALLVIFKEQLFRGGEAWLGYIGLAVDAVVNTGGIIPAACRIVVWPPVMAVVMAVSGAETPGAVLPGCNPFDALPLALSLIGGIILSVAPHRLWRN